MSLPSRMPSTRAGRQLALLALVFLLLLAGFTLQSARHGSGAQAAAQTIPQAAATAPSPAPDAESIQRMLDGYKPEARFADDRFVLAAVQEAAQGWREHNGGIGAVLVRASSGEIVERAHNSQYEPYFRSDRHAEMELLDRYEERLKLHRAHPERGKLRDLGDLVLYTSVEPCPMCLARMINAGVKRVYYAAPDEAGGMAKHIDALPEYWRQMAQGMTVEPARSSPELNGAAKSLFRPMHPANAAH